MDVPFWVWAITVTAIVAMLAFDFFGHVRTPHAPTLRESATWSAIYVALAVIFGILIWMFYGATFGGEYFAGYITEKSLSVDNLFVFVIIMASFGVPRELQQKVLLFGIAFALVLRTIFILIGAAEKARELSSSPARFCSRWARSVERAHVEGSIPERRGRQYGVP